MFDSHVTNQIRICYKHVAIVVLDMVKDTYIKK